VPQQAPQAPPSSPIEAARPIFRSASNVDAQVLLLYQQQSRSDAVGRRGEPAM
jgi:hypothetical protein